MLHAAARTGVYDREQLWGDVRATPTGRAIYHEFLEPNGSVWDCGMTAADSGAAFPAALSFHYPARPDAEQAEAIREVLGLLRPAFVSGVEAFLRLDPGWTSLGATLDLLSDGVAVFDGDGRLRHLNRGLRRLLADEDAWPRVRAEIRSVAAAALAAADGVASGGAGGYGIARRVRTKRGDYRVAASFLEGSAAPGGLAVAVVVRRTTPVYPTERELRRRYGLTPRQAEVTRLIARGMSNAAIARELSISPHTARRHTEAVLAKLAVSSRWDVERRIRGAALPAGDGDPPRAD